MKLYGRLMRARGTDPLRPLIFVEETNTLATDQYIRRVGRPRNEWGGMLQKEFCKMGCAGTRSINLKSDWESLVRQHCFGGTLAAGRVHKPS